MNQNSVLSDADAAAMREETVRIDILERGAQPPSGMIAAYFTDGQKLSLKALRCLQELADQAQELNFGY